MQAYLAAGPQSTGRSMSAKSGTSEMAHRVEEAKRMEDTSHVSDDQRSDLGSRKTDQRKNDSLYQNQNDISMQDKSTLE